MTFLPGKKREGYSGPHWRDVDLDARALADGGVSAMLLLVEDHELEWCLLPDLPAALAQAGVELIRFPIRDPRIPTAERIRPITGRSRTWSRGCGAVTQSPWRAAGAWTGPG